MRELKSLIKAIVNVVLLIAETAVFTNIFPVCAVCMCISGEYVGVRKGERKEAKPAFGKSEELSLRSSANLHILPGQKRFFSQEKFKAQLVAFSQASPFQK